MDPLSLLILFGLITIADEALNGQFKLSQRLWQWLERLDHNSQTRNSSRRDR
ncbi:MAG: hypothetical protein HC835_12815 [Oscillatoriales cyanobacterium RM2_1_1]|nr:hypothetical protein [Oscillatoriales cyanobacterium SM2_3_0]NJO46430.1 hypothetical protein [Oscillatoriales cyanobacterium RM2_1_1]